MADLFGWLISFFLLVALLVLITYQVPFFSSFSFSCFISYYTQTSSDLGFAINLISIFWKFLAANVPRRPRIWLYKSLRLRGANQFCGFGWIYSSRCPLLLLPCYWPLGYVIVMSSLSILQYQIVSFRIQFLICIGYTKICCLTNLNGIILWSFLFEMSSNVDGSRLGSGFGI